MAVAKDVPPAEYAVRAEAALAAGVVKLPQQIKNVETTLTLVPPGQYEVPQPLPK